MINVHQSSKGSRSRSSSFAPSSNSKSFEPKQVPLPLAPSAVGISSSSFKVTLTRSSTVASKLVHSGVHLKASLPLPCIVVPYVLEDANWNEYKPSLLLFLKPTDYTSLSG